MEDICRLCCSTNFVNNYIFDDENALYVKMSLYLPIKVFRNDRLPQKVCDKCSCKVNDFYQFCSETIAVQQRLRRALLLSAGVEIEDSIDLTDIKHDLSPMPPHYNDGQCSHKAEPVGDHNGEHSAGAHPHHVKSSVGNTQSHPASPVLHKKLSDQTTQTAAWPASTRSETQQAGTQWSIPIQPGMQWSSPVQPGTQWPVPTQPLFPDVKVKQEPRAHQVKQEVDEYDEVHDGASMETPMDSDCSEDNISLSKIKKERKKRKKQSNGQQKERKKRKPKIKSLEDLVGDALAMMPFNPEGGRDDGEDTKPVVAVKSEPVEFHCCICFVQCFSRSEMLSHYKEHLSSAMDARGPPPAPPPPPKEPIKCTRCLKSLAETEWRAHWLAHWQRDARPLRCALCEKTFRDPAQVLRHSLTHKGGGGGDAVTEDAPPKRFACDVCGEAFVYMRCLLAHRLSSHPEWSSRALALRCALCERTFAHLNSLRRHLRAHTGERNFLCSVCGKALSSREHLKFHLRIHTGYKPNVCKTCGKGFVKKCNLTLHERVHSGEKPHVCSSCGKAFSQRSTLVIHERYHSGARPYVCGLCGRGFVAKGLLSMHLKTTCI